MNKYISRDEAINAIKSLESSIPAKDNYSKGYDAALGRVQIAVRAVPPAADVLPIKYGEWIFQGQYDKEGRRIYHCSECNFEVGVFPYNFIAWRTHEKYCCGCGARMDGVTNG